MNNQQLHKLRTPAALLHYLVTHCTKCGADNVFPVALDSKRPAQHYKTVTCWNCGQVIQKGADTQ